MKFLLPVCLILAGCAASPLRRSSAKMTPASQTAVPINLEKKTAREWYRDGIAWADPKNPEVSYGKALHCFRQVDTARVNAETAQATHAWIAALTRLASAEEMAKEADKLRAAMKDAMRGSEVLQGKTAFPPEK